MESNPTTFIYIPAHKNTLILSKLICTEHSAQDECDMTTMRYHLYFTEQNVFILTYMHTTFQPFRLPWANSSAVIFCWHCSYISPCLLQRMKHQNMVLYLFRHNCVNVQDETWLSNINAKILNSICLFLSIVVSYIEKASQTAKLNETRTDYADINFFFSVCHKVPCVLSFFVFFNLILLGEAACY